MDTDSELEEDEEEILVYVDFESCATNNILTSDSLKLEMIGLDSDHPVMQVNGKFYQGSYEDAVGTYMFFENDKNPKVDDPVFDITPTLKYFNKTRKVLKMQRAFGIPRCEVIGDSEHKDCVPNMDTLKEAGVPVKYQDNALSFWKTIRDGRLDALNSYMEKQKKRDEMRSLGIEPESESDDDNPFMMYKYTDFKKPHTDSNEFDEFHGENFDTLKPNMKLQMNVRDNEPIRMIENLSMEDSAPSSSTGIGSLSSIELNDKIKSTKRVREKKSVKKPAKPKCRKATKLHSPQSDENEISNQELSNAENMDITEEFVHEENPQPKIPESTEETIDNRHRNNTLPERIYIKMESQMNSEMPEASDPLNDGGELLLVELGMNPEFSAALKQKKQDKREAKMREISAQMTQLAESSISADVMADDIDQS